MRIIINTKEVLFDCRNKNNSEMADIKDAEARYVFEAGSEKTDELERSLLTSASLLRAVYGRFLVSDTADDLALNGLEVPENLIFDLDMESRRAEGKSQTLADLTHAYIVDMTLSKFYTSVGAAERAAVHEKTAISHAGAIERLLFTKRPPFIHMHR